MATGKMEYAITEYSFSSGEMCWSIRANEVWFLCASKCHSSFVYSLWRWFSVPVVCRRFPLKNDLLVDFICVMVVDSLLKSITDIRMGNFSHSVCYCWAVRQLAELNPFSLSHSLSIHLKLVHHELKWMAFDHILCDDKLPIIWITNISNFPRASFTHIHPLTHHIFLSFVYFIVSISLFSFTSTVRCASYPLTIQTIEQSFRTNRFTFFISICAMVFSPSFLRHSNDRNICVGYRSKSKTNVLPFWPF